MILSLTFAIALVLPAAPGLPFGTPGGAVVPADFPVSGGPGVGYPGLATINRITNLPLTPEAQTIYDTEFQATGYFGAMAISKDGGYGYSSGTASLQAARDIAMAQCLSLNASCTVIAELLPEGYSPPPPGAVTLSQQIYGHFANAAKNPDFQALAVSEDGAFAMYWGMASQAEADRLALVDCEANRERGLSGLRDMPCVLVTNLP